MEKNEVNLLRICILPLLYAFIATTCFVHCDATRIIRSGKHTRSSNMKPARKFHQLRRLDMSMPLDSSNTDPYVSSPFSLPPYNSLPPFPFPENTPPFCVYPPFTPQTPTIPSPIQGYTPSPPPASSVPTLPGTSPILPPSPPQSSPIPNPPIIIPSPTGVIPNPPIIIPSPTSVVPNPPIIIPSPTSVFPNPPTVPAPTQPVLSPPYFEPGPPSYEPSPPSYEPSPPSYEPSPPYNIPSPFGFVPRSPTIFLPPIVFPPPAVPPPPHKGSTTAMWCVAKASVPEPIIEEAMNYACGSGADCDQIQPSGSCFQPNTLFAHASYAFNSYWQRTKVAGGTCDFGGTAILVTVDPSYDGCHFLYF